MEPMPWYQSQIIRAQIAMAIVGLLGLFGVSTDVLDAIPKLFEVLFAIVPLLITAYTILVRLFRPTPALTQKAAEKERDMILDGQPARPGASDEPNKLRNGGQL